MRVCIPPVEKEEEERKDINRRLKAEQLSMVQPATTAAALASLSRVEDLHDQIRVRKYCYGIPWKQLPSIGKDRGEGAVARLRRELTNVVLTQLPPRVASKAGPAMAAGDIAPTRSAQQSSSARSDAALLAYKEVLLMCESGVFYKPKHTGTRAGATQSSGRKRKPGVAAVRHRQERTPTEAEEAYAGVEFDEDGERWCCLMPGWSVEHEQVVIFYYNVQEACESGASVRDMEDAVLNDDSHDCVECSSVREVRQWVAATRRAEQKHTKRKKQRSK